MQLTGTNVSWKIKIITLYGCKLSKKNNIESHQNFTGSYEKSVDVLDELQDTQDIERLKGR